MGAMLRIVRRAGAWWITGSGLPVEPRDLTDDSRNIPVDAMGPYERKVEAEEDRKSIERFRKTNWRLYR